ncbi:MAG: dephospho-CoA kinase [Myxococcaceae bacterium]|nr:dephospho-CoA kinase [Myxococcaceae bacterium]
MRDKKGSFPTRHYGLTGGIASGKSTVRRMFERLGAVVIDADVLARRVVEPGQPALSEIAAAFPGVIDSTGALDRKKLGAIVFADPQARLKLNAITHPRISELAQALKADAEAQGAPVVIYEAPLLFENKLHLQNEGTVLVAVSGQVQHERLQKRDGLTPADALARIASQMPLEEKRKIARWVIDNGGSLEDTEAQVAKVWREMLATPA